MDVPNPQASREGHRQTHPRQHRVGCANEGEVQVAQRARAAPVRTGPAKIDPGAANCCPVITTSVGGIPSLIKHRHHGILISPKDSQILANSIIELIENENLRLEIITNAYKLAVEYTVENCTKRLAEAILH